MTALYASLRDQLADTLCVIAQMTDYREFRDAMARELRAHDIEVPELSASTPQLQCVQILDVVLASAGALDLLARQLLRYDSSDSTRRFRALVTKLLPEAYLTLQEKAAVVERLGALAHRDSFGSYYHAVVGRAAPQSFGSLWELVTQVAEDWPGGEELDPLLQIMVLTIGDSGDCGLAAECGQQAQELAARLDRCRSADGSATPQLELVRSMLARPDAADQNGLDEIAYIVLRLDPYNSKPDDLFLLSSWLFYGNRFIEKLSESSRALSLQSIKKEAIQLINESLLRAEQHSPRRFDPVIEFILPRAQLNMPVEKWWINADRPVPLGTQYVVVIRDLERQREAIQRTIWRERWDRVTDGKPSAEQVITRWISCAEKFHEGELYRQMCLAETAGAGLTFPPESPAHDLKIWELLDAGLPIAVWPHRCDHTATDRTPRVDDAGGDGTATEHEPFRQSFCAESSGRPVCEVPGIVRRLRTAHDDFNDENSGMALLWDDPTRIMKPDDFRLSAPGGSL